MAEVLEQPVALVHDGGLLRQAHGRGVLVRVAVQPDLVAGVADERAFGGEGLEGVAGDEPRGLDVVGGEEGEEAADADCAGEDAWSGGIVSGKAPWASSERWGDVEIRSMETGWRCFFC